MKSFALALVALAACATPRPAPPASPAPVIPPVPVALKTAAVDAGPAEPALPSPDDALEALWSRQIDFRNGAPTVTVRLMEGQSAVTFSPRSALTLHAHGGLDKEVHAPAGTPLTVRLVSGDPAKLGYAVQLGEFGIDDRDGIASARALWKSRGYAAHVVTEGSLYGIAGHVLDNRRALLVIGRHGPKAQAEALQDELARKFGVASLLHTELLERPSGVLEVVDANGDVLAQAQDLVVADDEGGAGFDVERVEFGVGYSWHGFANRSYRGRLLFTVDTHGELAVINAVKLEELLRGLVPSEIPAKSPMEALKAQAVTARGEVLAKIGVRHLTDPYLFCSEQHCQVYSGIGGETPATDAAVRATAGQALFLPDGGKLVDTVYSAICGGYTENNENVWAGPPNPALRGVPDVIGPARGLPDGGIDSAHLPAFLASKLPFACKLASASVASKFRWTRRFSAEDVDALLANLKVGHVLAMKVTERGVSGRAIALTVSGDAGAGEIRGELNIRKAFRNLPSSMFVLKREGKSPRAGWLFTGGGWGHGVGMCQVGAIGRAEHGQNYREILAHYFQGSELVKIY